MNCVPVLRYLHIVCIFAIGQCLHLLRNGLYQKPVCALGKLVCIVTLLLLGQNEAHERSLVKWLQIATVIQEILEVVEIFPNLAHIQFQ